MQEAVQFQDGNGPLGGNAIAFDFDARLIIDFFINEYHHGRVGAHGAIPFFQTPVSRQFGQSGFPVFQEAFTWGGKGLFGSAVSGGESR